LVTLYEVKHHLVLALLSGVNGFGTEVIMLKAPAPLGA
jgi:hypothetical protein